MATRSALPAACTAALADQLRPELFQALCDPVRLGLLARLATASGPLTVSEVASCCGVHLSGVSRHLALLKSAGVVQAERHGREVRYALECDALVGALRGLADAIEACRAACCTQEGERGCNTETSGTRSEKRTPTR